MTNARWRQVTEDLRSKDSARAVRASQTLADIAETVNVPELYALLRDGSFFVREAAAVPLARLVGLTALSSLLEAYGRGLRDGQDNDGLTATIGVLIEGEPKQAAELLLELLKTGDDEMRANAAWALGFAASEITPDVLIDLVDHDPAWAVKLAAVGSLSSFRGYADVLAKLVGLVDAPDEQIAIEAVYALGYLEDPAAIPAIETALRTATSQGVRNAAEYALSRLKS